MCKIKNAFKEGFAKIQPKLKSDHTFIDSQQLIHFIGKLFQHQFTFDQMWKHFECIYNGKEIDSEMMQFFLLEDIEHEITFEIIDSETEEEIEELSAVEIDFSEWFPSLHLLPHECRIFFLVVCTAVKQRDLVRAEQKRKYLLDQKTKTVENANNKNKNKRIKKGLEKKIESEENVGNEEFGNESMEKMNEFKKFEMDDAFVINFFHAIVL